MSTPVCGACGGAIAGTYLSLDEQTYHEACFWERVAPRCANCHELIADRYYADYWGERLCPRCNDACPRCRYCSRRAAGGAAGTSGDSLCTACRSAAVITAADAEPRLRAMFAWLAGQGLAVPLRTRLCVELREEAQMKPWLDDGDPQPWGLARKRPRRPGGQPLPGSRPDKIILQLGLPSPLFEGVAVHELGHIWLGAHAVTGLPK